MNSESVKGKPLTREETKYLLDLIESSKTITSKTTNAANNKMKNDEWQRLTTKFNANATNCPRTPQQIRLKWENLKKNARKRSTKIRMSQFKTGGGPPEYIPPDDILDRVTSLLGSTASGFSVPFGGDREDPSVTLTSQDCEAVQVSGDVGGSDGFGVAMEITDTTEVMPVDSGAGTVISDMGMAGSGVVVTNCQILDNIKITNPIKRQFFNTQRTGRSNKTLKKDDKRTARNQAIADYYIAKKECLDKKMQNIQLQNESLKLNNVALKLQNDKLLLETEKIKLELEKLRNQE